MRFIKTKTKSLLVLIGCLALGSFILGYATYTTGLLAALVSIGQFNMNVAIAGITLAIVIMAEGIVQFQEILRIEKENNKKKDEVNEDGEAD